MRSSILLLASALLFASLPASPAGNEPARALSSRGLDNVVAFTRLLGYVRYFHPSDQAAAADWDAFAIAGVRRVESATDAAELARVLEDLFRPVAPTVRVFPPGTRPALPAALARPADPQDNDVRAVQWRHLGLYTGFDPLFRDLRVDDWAVPSGINARMVQEIDAAPFRGKTVRLRAFVRAELPEGQHVRLWLKVFRPRNENGFSDEMTDRPLDREGKVWLDDLSLEIDGSPADPRAIANPAFEEEAIPDQVAGWAFWSGEEAAGYTLTPSSDQPHGGKHCALLASADPKSLVTARPDEPFVADLGGGVSALIPLALWADASGMLPHAEKAPDAAASKASGKTSGDDRATASPASR
ncbi:MAG TPA: hypothetical protein VH988_25705 [Thermoanaerobaculia bacterium]|jgi:hypothetical protein|nr:hypothetical protein [Thermoanaerobaculia bacterium]